MHGKKLKSSPVKHSLQSKVDGKWVEKPHDHQGSGKLYGEKGHSGKTTHWTESSKESKYMKPKN